ncbi:hypothetical protein RMB03_18250 [Acinetobacter sp. V91_7]|uniref:hypothetical protein n=1 Tax=unclassified Acinetobacter TaxID=196816 RepID=UPI00287C45F2|nr:MULTISPECIES: hypothetical protein [unclassified Acinetobacter]MDS7933289.1 hypothetical protein [Acinetobacter sp. V91_4B]MDS7964893.1 hypothetical protein [Acinetobacter sp. V91_7]MDS8027900.1 hypothetical protein [Acinetobacter sp. V91_13]
MATVNATDVIDGDKNQHEINNVNLAHGYAHWRDLREFGTVLADQTTDHTTLILNALSQLSEGEALYIPRKVKWSATSNPSAVYASMKDNCVVIDDSGYESRYIYQDESQRWQASQQIYYKTKDYGTAGRRNGNGLNLRANYNGYLNFEMDGAFGTKDCKATILWRMNNGTEDSVQIAGDGVNATKAHLAFATYGAYADGATALKMGLQNSIAPHSFNFNADMVQDVSFIFGKRIKRLSQGTPEDDLIWRASKHVVRWSQPLDHKGDFEQSWVVRETVDNGPSTKIVQIHNQLISFSNGDITWTLKDGTTITLMSLIDIKNGKNQKKNIITPSTTYSLVNEDSGSYISNVNASGGYIVNLPKAVKGLHFEFSVDSLNNLRIQPNTADNFVSLNPGKYKQSNTIGSRLRVTAVTDNMWSVEQIGTWTDQV